jgi:hypothetical protein
MFAILRRPAISGEISFVICALQPCPRWQAGGLSARLTLRARGSRRSTEMRTDSGKHQAALSLIKTAMIEKKLTQA